MQPLALHVSPHPDDEAVGCGATITTLIDAGWRVVNMLTTQGRPGQEERRLQEARAAADAGGYTVELAPEVVLSSELIHFEDRLVSYLLTAITKAQPQIVLSTSPHDGHPRHEAVGRAIARASRALTGLRWWIYPVWTDLALPTLYVEVDETRLERILLILSQYGGELSRQDYSDMVTGRARAARVIGSEKILGYGASPMSRIPYAELITEAVYSEGDWFAGSPRILAADNILADPSTQPLGSWIDRRSDHDALNWRRPSSRFRQR